jgi:hypothetical protein
MPTSADWDAVKLVLVVVAMIIVGFWESGFLGKLWRTWKGKRD